MGTKKVSSDFASPSIVFRGRNQYELEFSPSIVHLSASINAYRDCSFFAAQHSKGSMIWNGYKYMTARSLTRPTLLFLTHLNLPILLGVISFLLRASCTQISCPATATLASSLVVWYCSRRFCRENHTKYFSVSFYFNSVQHEKFSINMLSPNNPYSETCLFTSSGVREDHSFLQVWVKQTRGGRAISS